MQELHSLAGLANAFQCPRGYPITLGPPAPVKCPRCESTNTKFCYYNNYNLSQPRHFCKSCRRYWTRGGLLRNVPVGGGIRKSKSKSKSKTKSKKPFSVEDNNPNSDPNVDPSPDYVDPLPVSVHSRSDSDVRQIAVTDPTAVFGFSDSVTDLAGNEFPVLHENLCSSETGSGSLFDVTGSVPYWNQCGWADADPSALYLS